MCMLVLFYLHAKFWMFVPHPLTIPEIHLLKPNPHCDSIWRQSFGRWLDHEGEVSWTGLVLLRKRPLRAPYHFSLWSQWEDDHLWTRKGALTRQNLPWSWTSKPLPQLFVRNKFLLSISCSVYGILLMSAGMDWDTPDTQTCNYWTSYSVLGTAKHLGIFSIILTVVMCSCY